MYKSWELKNHIAHSRFSLEVTVGSNMNELFPQKEDNAAFIQSYFFQALRIEAVIIACIMFFGVFYEFGYRKQLAKCLKLPSFLTFPSKCAKGRYMEKVCDCVEMSGKSAKCDEF